MSLIVHPDPQEPTGGFAFLELPEGALPGDTVTVAVQDAFADRWLGADRDVPWQGERHDFGPYDVHRQDGADWVRIGPEIVDRLVEYMPLRFMVGPETHVISWPDDVPPRPAAAERGAIRATGRTQPPPEPPRPVTAPMARPVEPPSVGSDSAAFDEDIADPLIEDEAEPEARSRRLWVLVVLVLLLLAALVAIWLLVPEKDEPATAQTPLPPDATSIKASPTETGSASPAPDRCTFDALSGLGGGFGAVERALARCGGAVSPDVALRLVEDAAARGDGDALLVFGMLYDGDAVQSGIEDKIGLTFGDDPAKAAAYYARAMKAGTGQAKPRLDAVCAHLAGASGTLEKGAFDDYCR